MPSLPQRARQTDYARPGEVLSSPLQWFSWLLHRSPGAKSKTGGGPERRDFERGHPPVPWTYNVEFCQYEKGAEQASTS